MGETPGSAQVPAWRQQAPYGAPRSTPAAWIDNRAFLDKPADAATGRFTSPDRVLEPGSPQLLNGYTYTADNPVSTSDPTGQMVASDTCNGSACYDGGGSTAGGNSPAPAPVDTNYGGLGGPAPGPVDTNYGGGTLAYVLREHL